MSEKRIDAFVKLDETILQRCNILKLKVDDGTQSKKISTNTFEQMYLSRSNDINTHRVTTYKGTQIKYTGTNSLICIYNNSSFKCTEFCVVDVANSFIV